MPELRNPKHEAFAQAIAKGKNGVQAYTAAGYNPKGNGQAARSAYRLRRIERISDRIDELGGKKRRRIAAEQVAESIRTGRPTTYRPELDELARRLALMGATLQETADVLGVPLPTLENWLQKYPNFRRAISRGSMLADAKVAEKLYHRALGARIPAVHFAQHEGEIISKDYVKHFPPDTSAARMWLTNRQNAKWKWREEVEHKAPIDILREKIAAMTPDEQLEWMRSIEQRMRLALEHQPAEDDEIPE